MAEQPQVDYNTLSPLDRADLHIVDARGLASNAMRNLQGVINSIQAAMNGIQIVDSLSNNRLEKRLNPEQLIAVAQVHATNAQATGALAMAQAMLSNAHAQIAMYLLGRNDGMYEPQTVSIQIPNPYQITDEDHNGQEGNETVSEEQAQASSE